MLGYVYTGIYHNGAERIDDSIEALVQFIQRNEGHELTVTDDMDLTIYQKKYVQEEFMHYVADVHLAILLQFLLDEPQESFVIVK
ncbi:hypothetical protein [Merdibacter massiliensis]|uniref:hypothetical protein n=1 Tax=Merdibacter massiliensis TaxID=1871030 RepID=UPI00096A6933|nr:hypothetical protein [Merdibacter massiliensis]